MEAQILILLNVAHFIGDYTHASTPTMLKAKRYGVPLGPIIAHAGVHATLFFFVVWMYNDIWCAVAAGVVQLVSHAIIDTTKGRLTALFLEFENPANKRHWYLFGADQFLHQIVIIVTVYFVCL